MKRQQRTGPDATVRLRAGAGFAGDRLDPAATLVTRGALDVLIFELLAERTLHPMPLHRAKRLWR